VPAGRAVAEDGTGLVLPEERVYHRAWNGTRRGDGASQPSDREEAEAWRERADPPLVIPAKRQREGVGGWRLIGRGNHQVRDEHEGSSGTAPEPAGSLRSGRLWVRAGSCKDTSGQAYATPGRI
jgi:hypothetical protein